MEEEEQDALEMGKEEAQKTEKEDEKKGRRALAPRRIVYKNYSSYIFYPQALLVWYGIKTNTD